MSKVVLLKLRIYKKLGNLNLLFIKLKTQKKLQLFILIKLRKFVFVLLITALKMALIRVII